MRRRQHLTLFVLALIGCGDDAAMRVPDASVDAPQCPVVMPAPDVDPWGMRVPSAGFGSITMEQNGGHSDLFLASPGGTTRIGVRLDWGGTVVFFGPTAGPNVIDANDTGRELQLALYDPSRAMQGCAVTATCQTIPSPCANSITFLGWDPVQGGDECGHGAQVLESGRAGDAMRVVVRPLQWNPDWDALDCRQTPCGASGVPVAVKFIFELRFVAEDVVEIASEVQSEESFSHPVTAQEFPTLYVAHDAFDLPLLLDSSGAAVSLTTPGNDGFFYGNFTSPAPWVTWQTNDRSAGVAIGSDQGITMWQGWRGDGQTAPYFHNVRQQIAFGLPQGGTVRGISYLALGGFDHASASMNAVLRARPPFGHIDSLTRTRIAGWVLDNDRIPTVTLERDGASLVPIAVEAVRDDVCAVYPAYPNCPGGGIDTAIPPTPADGCAHLLRLVATDTDGNRTILGERMAVP
jgi:hypothetical protein